MRRNIPCLSWDKRNPQMEPEDYEHDWHLLDRDHLRCRRCGWTVEGPEPWEVDARRNGDFSA